MARKVHDLIENQDALLARQYRFILSPEKWSAYRDKRITGWKLVRLQKTERSSIPSVSGIYTLLVQPLVAKHPSCSYLMYVGQAVNLRKRFGEYLSQERKASGRPKVFRLLNVYDKHIWFAYADVPENQLNAVEDGLIEAYLPPCNDKLPAAIRQVGNAF